MIYKKNIQTISTFLTLQDISTGDKYHTWYLSFFTQAKFLENKIYTEKTRKLRHNTQKSANLLRYYGKIHSKLPIFRVKSVKNYTSQKKIYTSMLLALVTNIRYALMIPEWFQMILKHLLTTIFDAGKLKPKY